jgi:hypothetical protein
MTGGQLRVNGKDEGKSGRGLFAGLTVKLITITI